MIIFDIIGGRRKKSSLWVSEQVYRTGNAHGMPSDFMTIYNYTLSLVDGDIVSVTTSCNEDGDLTGTMTIGEEITTSDTTSTDNTSDTEDEATIRIQHGCSSTFPYELGILIQHNSRLRQR